jgi:hypothetical protein
VDCVWRYHHPRRSSLEGVRSRDADQH